jgi:hypothetical protein
MFIAKVPKKQVHFSYDENTINWLDSLFYSFMNVFIIKIKQREKSMSHSSSKNYIKTIIFIAFKF